MVEAYMHDNRPPGVDKPSSLPGRARSRELQTAGGKYGWTLALTVS